MASHQIRNLIEATDKDTFSLMMSTCRNEVRMSAHTASVQRATGDPS